MNPSSPIGVRWVVGFLIAVFLAEDGTPKQAFDTWQELYQVEFTESGN